MAATAKVFRRTDISRQDLFDKVGNGGLSLRRINSFIEACERYGRKLSDSGNTATTATTKTYSGRQLLVISNTQRRKKRWGLPSMRSPNYVTNVRGKSYPSGVTAGRKSGCIRFGTVHSGISPFIKENRIDSEVAKRQPPSRIAAHIPFLEPSSRRQVSHRSEYGHGRRQSLAVIGRNIERAGATRPLRDKNP